MRGRHVYADESKRAGYVVAAVEVDASQVAAVRRVVAGLRAAGTKRVHFQSESDGARRRFLAELTHLHMAGQLSARLYISEEPRDLDARIAILDRLVRDLVATGGARLILERDDSTIVDDQRAIRAARASAADLVRFDHMRAADEPLLWPPDAIAWAWYRDRAWRALVDSIVDGVPKA